MEITLPLFSNLFKLIRKLISGKAVAFFAILILSFTHTSIQAQIAQAKRVLMNESPACVKRPQLQLSAGKRKLPAASSPMGIVTFYDNNVIIGTGTITGGIATLATTFATAATHPITARLYLDVTTKRRNKQSTIFSQVVTTAVTATITYSTSPRCKGAGGVMLPTVTPTGGTYASTLGLSINVNTGTINVAASTAGTYTVTYTPPLGNGCPATTTVNIFATPAATISYSSASYCSNVAPNPTATITGTPGGTFSSAGGLTIDPVTGTITPSTSTPGTYTISYIIPAAGGCTAVTATTSVTITALPTATISYASGTYCSSDANPTPTQTGTAGGTYTAPAGVVINAATGQINLAASTAGGPYTINYSFPASGGCPAVVASTSVTINAAPAFNVTIAPVSGTVCSGVDFTFTFSNNAIAYNWSRVNTANLIGMNANGTLAVGTTTFVGNLTDNVGVVSAQAETFTFLHQLLTDVPRLRPFLLL